MNLSDASLNKQFNDVAVYIDWYVTMLVLNGMLDPKKVGLHRIYLHSTEEMRNDRPDLRIYHDYMDGRNFLEHWRHIHKLPDICT